MDFVLYANNDDKNEINLHGHVSIDKDAAKALGNTIGSQIGLGASIVGIGTAVSKGIAKSSMPPSITKSSYSSCFWFVHRIRSFCY